MDVYMYEVIIMLSISSLCIFQTEVADFISIDNISGSLVCVGSEAAGSSTTEWFSQWLLWPRAVNRASIPVSASMLMTPTVCACPRAVCELCLNSQNSWDFGALLMVVVKWEWLCSEPVLWHPHVCVCVCAYICICGCLTAEGCVLSIKVNEEKILNVGQGAQRGRMGGWAVPLSPLWNLLFSNHALDAFRLCHHPAMSCSRLYLYYIKEHMPL